MDQEMDAELINEDLAPVPDIKRTWSKWNIAALWIGMAICIPTYTLASGMVDQGWSWQASVCAVILGNLIVLIPMLLNAHAGTRYGIPFPVLLRSSFGIYGANIPALMRAFVACGWFGIQTWVGGSALFQLSFALFPNLPSLPDILPAFFGISTGQFLAFIVFWLINVAVIYRGMESIRVLQTWSAPFLLFTGVAMLAWALWSVGSLTTLFSNQAPVTRSFWSALTGAGLTSGVAYWGTLALNIPDFARFAKSQKDQIVGQSIGLPPTMAFYAFIGAIVTNATFLIFGSRISDPVQLLSTIGGTVTTVLAMIGVLIATLTTNLAANIVSPANDFSNLRPNLISFRKGAMIASVAGLLIMPWKLYLDAGQYIFTWLVGYGAFLGSIAGIMIVEYYLIRKMELNVVELYKKNGSYRYLGGFNLRAIAAMCLGIAPNIPGLLMALNVVETSEFWFGIYQRGWFVSFGIAGALHFIFAKVMPYTPVPGSSHAHQGST